MRSGSTRRSPRCSTTKVSKFPRQVRCAWGLRNRGACVWGSQSSKSLRRSRCTAKRWCLLPWPHGGCQARRFADAVAVDGRAAAQGDVVQSAGVQRQQFKIRVELDAGG
eukprot:7376278-Prymnesium_polylepis.1